ncbi:MAG: hypothetical protein EOO75_10835 [Myxococcales bacterium]|nr:MAG: hypothetical protein EOO75_10835 [Myxococcales bacterium]
MTMTGTYRGDMSRADALEKLKGLAGRLGVEPGAVRVRPVAGSDHGMSLQFVYRDVTITRESVGQASRDKNFACLVLWLGDLVRNIERRIETLEEAFYTDGARLLPSGTSAYGETAENLYTGGKTIEESLDLVRRSLERLGLSERDVKLTWDAERNEARLRLRLRSGAVVDKVSQGQRTVDHNLAALALWLQARAKNVERGIERDLDRLFAANLLPAAS